MKSFTHKGIGSALFILTAASVTPSMAAQSYDTSPFDGYYLGGGLGGSFSSAKDNSIVTTQFSTSTVANLPLNTSSFTHSETGAQRKNRLAAGLYAGYGYVSSNLYLGMEAFLNYSGYNNRTKRYISIANHLENGLVIIPMNFREAIISRVKLQNYEGGVDLRPGILLVPSTLLYGRIGVGYNKGLLCSKLNDRFVLDDVLIVNPPTFSQSFTEALHRDKYKKIGSLRLGLGLEQNLCDNLSIRADYVSTNYRSVKAKLHHVFIGSSGTTTFTNKIEIKRFYNNTVTLGMSYYW